MAIPDICKGAQCASGIVPEYSSRILRSALRPVRQAQPQLEQHEGRGAHDPHGKPISEEAEGGKPRVGPLLCLQRDARGRTGLRDPEDRQPGVRACPSRSRAAASVALRDRAAERQTRRRETGCDAARRRSSPRRAAARRRPKPSTSPFAPARPAPPAARRNRRRHPGGHPAFTLAAAAIALDPRRSCRSAPDARPADAAERDLGRHLAGRERRTRRGERGRARVGVQQGGRLPQLRTRAEPRLHPRDHRLGRARRSLGSPPWQAEPARGAIGRSPRVLQARGRHAARAPLVNWAPRIWCPLWRRRARSVFTFS